MKKINLYYGVAILLASIGFSSCADEVVSTPVSVNTMPKATISGYVSSEMNLQSAGSEAVPTGTKLFVEVNFNDINNAATGKWQDTVSVSADGKYSVSVPADANGVSVKITPFPFEAEQTQVYGSLYEKVTKAYTSAQVTVSIRSGQSLAQDIAYSAAALPLFTEKVRISGKAQANLNAEIVGLENIPDGTIINFYNGEWKDSVAVQNGTYSILVPAGDPIAWKCEFKYAKKVWVKNTTNPSLSGYSNINYKYKITGSNTYNSNTVDVDLSAGEGTDLTVDPNKNIVLVSGKAQAETDESSIGYEAIPDGLTITFYDAEGNTWGGTATVLNGKYSINIPRNMTITYYAKFTTNKKVFVGVSETYPTGYTTKQYTYSLVGTISSSNATYTFDMNAGAGTDATVI